MVHLSHGILVYMYYYGPYILISPPLTCMCMWIKRERKKKRQRREMRMRGKVAQKDGNRQMLA